MKYVTASSLRWECRIAAHLARRYREEYRRGDDAACRIAVAYRMSFLGMLQLLKRAVEIEAMETSPL